MAQLKSLLVNGPTRLIGDLFTNKIELTSISAPTSSGGTTYGLGSSGQILKSNGSSVYWAADNNSVTGVKGNSESSYRTGNVNITAANIGLGNVNNTADADKTVKYADMPTGFASRNSSFSWGNQTGTAVTVWNDSSGGSIGFRKDNPSSGQISMLIDGTVYIKEGAVNISDAIKSISRNGTTFTYTTLWGNTGTFTQQDNNTTYTFASGTNGFTVTPSGGTAQTVTVTPSITNNITGSGASGYLTKFNGTNTITNGPALGSSTTTFLRNDGTWATPPVTSVAGKTGAVALGTLTIGGKTYNGSSNTTIEIADLGLASTTTFLGITSTNLSDGSTTNPITVTIGPTTGSVTASNGSVVMEQESGEEFIWTGSKWNLMGLASSWALANHIHGNILNNGTITSNGVALAANDRLLFSDNSNSGKIERSSITFDGSTTSKFLSQKGTWEAVQDASTSQKGIVQLVDSVSSTATNMAATAKAVKTAYDAVAGKVNKSGDTMTGPLTVKVLKGTNNIDYGGALPATATEGQIFFQTSAPHYELPAGGATGAVLVKNSNNDRDVKWSLDNVAKSFTVTLSSSSWSNNVQTVSNANFFASGFGYIVTPAGESFVDYAAASIYADNVTTNGSMTFHCARLPVSDLTVNIMRMVSL